MYEELFAERISELRLKKGVSARDMSLSLGQNSGYINHIENRYMMPSMTGFFNICDYFSITPQEFFTFDDKDPNLSNNVLLDLSRLEEKELDSLCILIHALASKSQKAK